MTVQIKDHLGRRGLKVSSVTYTFTAAAVIKRPSLAVVFVPAGPQLPRHRRRVNLRIVLFHVNLKGPLTSFSGSLPARVIAEVNRRGGLPGGYQLMVNLANIVKRTRRFIEARMVMQEGLVLTPAAIFVQRAPR